MHGPHVCDGRPQRCTTRRRRPAGVQLLDTMEVRTVDRMELQAFLESALDPVEVEGTIAALSAAEIHNLRELSTLMLREWTLLRLTPEVRDGIQAALSKAPPQVAGHGHFPLHPDEQQGPFGRVWQFLSKRWKALLAVPVVFAIIIVFRAIAPYFQRGLDNFPSWLQQQSPWMLFGALLFTWIIELVPVFGHFFVSQFHFFLAAALPIYIAGPVLSLSVFVTSMLSLIVTSAGGSAATTSAGGHTTTSTMMPSTRSSSATGTVMAAPAAMASAGGSVGTPSQHPCAASLCGWSCFSGWRLCRRRLVRTCSR